MDMVETLTKHRTAEGYNLYSISSQEDGWAPRRCAEGVASSIAW